jgi:hypothetical protein
MSFVLSTRLDNRPPNLDELAHLCVVALQIYYDGKCPEECLEARARDFAAWHLARSAMILQRANGNEDVHSDHWGAPVAINGRVRLERE